MLTAPGVKRDGHGQRENETGKAKRLFSLLRTTVERLGRYLFFSLVIVVGLALWMTPTNRKSSPSTGDSVPTPHHRLSRTDRPGAHPSPALPTPHGLRRPDGEERARISESYGKLPLSFESNQGQADPQIDFISRGKGYSIYLKPSEAIIALNMATDKVTSGKPLYEPKSLWRENGKREHALVKMKLVGANVAPRVRGVERLNEQVRYFIGNDPTKWQADVPTFAKVSYQEVYPGIDLIYYGNQRRLEYDFNVAAGADPRAIKLTFEGVKALEIDGQGDLILRTPSGDVRQHRPVIYQEVGHVRHVVSGHYVVTSDNQVGFELEAYDETQSLTIDPVLSYSTYLGNGGNEAGFDIAVDGAGNAYVTGTADSPEFSTSGGSNAFVMKLNATGTARSYFTVLGGDGDDIGFGIAVDGAGNAYVTGSSDSTNFPTTNALQSSFGGGDRDAFIAKLNPTGASVGYSTYLGGSGDDAGLDIAVDDSGNAYVVGSTSSAEFSLLGGNNAFVTKLNPAGNVRVYLAALGGSGDDKGLGIAVDSIGNAYITGLTDSTNFTTANPLQATIGGLYDAFLAKLNATGSTLVYSTYLGGGGNDAGFAVTADLAGSAYVTGSTDSTEFSNLGGTNVFVSRLNASGSERSYFTVLGGSGNDAGFGVAVDKTGSAYITGFTDSANFTLTNPIQSSLGGGAQDAFVARLDVAGSALAYSTYLGGNGDDAGLGIGIDNKGNLYVTGFTNSSNLSTPGVVQSTFGGGGDTFVTKITDGATVSSTLQFSNTDYNVTEGQHSVQVVLTRTGDLSGTATVFYQTVNQNASDRTDYTAALGTLHFAPNESTKTLNILVTNDVFVEGSETFIITLSSSGGAVLGLPTTATVKINDNDTVAGPHPVKDGSFNSEFFVRQHYADFLNREPDSGGLAFWMSQIDECTTQQCQEIRRINVSAAFYLSIEFQETGYLVYRMYKAAFGNLPNKPVPITIREFLPDTQRIGQGVVVGIGNWQAQLEANKNSFASEFVSRSRFTDAYPQVMSPTQFVNALNANTENSLTTAEVNLLVQELAGDNTSQGRASVLRKVAENAEFRRKEFNSAFVQMQYFGYLRRDPDDVGFDGRPDPAFNGYNFWLTKLNQFNGNFVQAEMVKAFITSIEYGDRFGP